MANSSNPYAPDETAAQIFNDETWLQGELLSCVAYGVELTLFVMCFGIVARQINRSNYKRQLAILSFVTVIFGLGTTFMVAQAVFTQIAFVRNRNFPGGPGAFEVAKFSVSPNEISIACFVVGNWLMDIFLVHSPLQPRFFLILNRLYPCYQVWRYTVIYRACATAWRVVLIMIPCLMLCASICACSGLFLGDILTGDTVLGIMALVQTSRALPFRDVDIMLSYYVMSVSLNIIVTLLIVGRLFYYRHWMFQTLGRSNTSACYANISAMLIESASLYSVFAILFLVPFGMGNALGNVFLQTVSQVQVRARGLCCRCACSL